MQLLRGSPGEVGAWLRRGVVPVTVGRLGAWTVVLPRGVSRAAPPYTDPLPILAARPVPARLGPALGFWVVDDRAVIAVAGARRTQPRWVVWDPAEGVVRPPGLEVAPVSALLRAAGGGSGQDVLELLRERHVRPERLLAALVAVLELPGAQLVLDAEGEAFANVREALAVEPEDREVATFDESVRDAVLLRRELELET